MKKYNFDCCSSRQGTKAIKFDALELNFGRADLTPLWIADMDFDICPQIVDAMVRRMEHPVYGYSLEGEGYWQSIIDWLKRRHGIEVKRHELTFVAGVVRGLAFAINYFSAPGDKIVIQPPVYHPFRFVIEGNDRQVVENPLIETQGDAFYKMDLEGLEKIFAQERPKMMILCNPHNPAGIQWSADELRKVAALARKYNVVVVSDEIHGDLMLWKRPHVPFAFVSDDAEAVAVTLGAPSKTFNIPGMASSWIMIRNEQLRSGFFHWMEVNEFSAPIMTATIAAEAAYTNGEQWLEQLLEYVEGNVEATEQFCKENLKGVVAVRPQASFLVWLDCRGLGLTQTQLEDLFVNKARLALNSGTMFGRQGQGFMRLNVAMPRQQLLQALQQLRQAIV